MNEITKDAWQDAYDQGYTLGRQMGHAEGFAEARAFDEDEPPLPVFVDPAITALFGWRNSRTDYCGEDLESLLMAEFSSDPYLSHHNRKSVPAEHEAGLVAFRALSLEEQYQIVKNFAG